jgi:signal peptidase I
MKKLRYLLPILVVAALFYAFRLYKIDGTSMNYGLVDGDLVVSYRLFHTIRRGDMLVFRHPDDPDDRLYIKRCVALPGDRFFEKERSFYLQLEGDSEKTRQLAQHHDLTLVKTRWGYFLKDPYQKYYGIVHNRRLLVPSVLTTLPMTTVPPHHYYMLGDYRDNSADSRFFGAVPRSWIYSKIVLIIKKPHNWLSLVNIEEADKAVVPSRRP